MSFKELPNNTKRARSAAWIPTKVAACQVPDIREDMDASLRWIEDFSRQAQEQDVSLICFPECCLQGYLTNERVAKNQAVDLSSANFEAVLQRLARYTPIIVFGLIEKETESLFNTAVVIREGKLLGRYRKTHLLSGEKIFKTGCNYPVFDSNKLRFGINICYDTQFPEAAENIARQGARLILCPANNMMRYDTAEKFKDMHHTMRMQRVQENGIWLVSADVTGEREGRISYGPTSAINPAGHVVAQVPLGEVGMIVVEIDVPAV